MTKGTTKLLSMNFIIIKTKQKVKMVPTIRKLENYCKYISKKLDLNFIIMGSFPKNRKVAFKYED